MKTIKRVAAILLIVLLVGLYILTLISGILATPQTGNLFRACIYCTVTVPCFLYGLELIYRLLHKNRDIDEKGEKENDKSNK